MSYQVYTRSTATSAWEARDHKADSLVISDTVNERSTATVTILDTTGTLHYQRGVGVKIERDNELVFSGFVDRATEARLGPGGVREHQLDIIDLHYLMDKRIVAASYQDFTCGQIAIDLLNGALFPEGVTAGLIQPGPTIRAITFNYVRASDAILELANRAGFWWRINPDATLDFASPLDLLTLLTADTIDLTADTTEFTADAVEVPGSGAATIDLLTEALADTVTVTRHSSGYRNRQWLQGGRDRTVPQTEVQFGDGQRRAFALGFPVAIEPTVEVSRDGGAFEEEDVGVQGLQSNRTWLWAYGSTALQQNALATVLAPEDRVRIVYTGLFDVIARVEDTSEHVARASLEGGSGVVESVLVDRTSSSQDAAFQLASELVGYYSQPATVVRFATARQDLVPGVVLRATYGAADLVNVEALVTNVELFTRAGVPRAVVTMVAGPIEGSWAQWFGALSRRIDRYADLGGGEVEVVTTLEEFEKTWTEAELPNIYREVAPGTGLEPGSPLVPSFEPSERVLFMAWHLGGVELGRKVITTQVGAQAGETELRTTVVLSTFDAVGSIDELSWWGGSTASLEAGSGVEVDRQAFVKTKTDIEQVQVVKTDWKWT